MRKKPCQAAKDKRKLVENMSTRAYSNACEIARFAGGKQVRVYLYCSGKDDPQKDHYPWHPPSYKPKVRNVEEGYAEGEFILNLATDCYNHPDLARWISKKSLKGKAVPWELVKVRDFHVPCGLTLRNRMSLQTFGYVEVPPSVVNKVTQLTG